MPENSFSDRIRDAVKNYYRYNPDTLMPLLMVALAARKKLFLSYHNMEGTVTFCSIVPKNVLGYSRVRHEQALHDRLKNAILNNYEEISVKGVLDKVLLDIYQIFYQYDTYTVEQEYHHRIGILRRHSRNEPEDTFLRQYATLCLADILMDTPDAWLMENFLEVANGILVQSGIQPERPRLYVAEVLCFLLQYDGKGKVYNPFAGCAIAASMLNVGDRLYADADTNEKLYAVARLFLYATGNADAHIEQRDSTGWIQNESIDYLITTYRGYIAGKAAFDFCLSRCFGTTSERIRYAGVVLPVDLFDKRSDEMDKALQMDWIDTIVLLPFAEVAVLVDSQKIGQHRGKVRFFNLTHPMLEGRPVAEVLSEDSYADFYPVSDIAKKGFLKKLVSPVMNDREGYEIIYLKNLVRKINRRVYSLSSQPYEKRVLADIMHKIPYDRYNYAWMNGIVKRPVSSLFEPVYHMESDCLITSDRGNLEPRLFSAEQGAAFFYDGYAFEIKKNFDSRWLLAQLNENYVYRQLHPYGKDEMVMEPFTEDQVLGIRLYRETAKTEGIGEENPDADQLSYGSQLKHNNIEYTIHDFLGHGDSGYMYSAMSHHLITGEQKEVVLKEYYPYHYFRRVGMRAVLKNGNDAGTVDASRKNFQEKAEIMSRLSRKPDSHIVPVLEVFNSEESGTVYYVMPYYKKGSLSDLLNSGVCFTEELVLEHVISPLCKALYTAHASKVLHLDIKPENILVDDNGDALLVDFDFARQYDTDGNTAQREKPRMWGVFTAPELKEGNMVKFGVQADIYGLAASVYYLMAAPALPHPVVDFSDQDKDLHEHLKKAGCSEQFSRALIAGLRYSAVSRPFNIRKFLQLFRAGGENPERTLRRISGSGNYDTHIRKESVEFQKRRLIETMPESSPEISIHVKKMITSTSKSGKVKENYGLEFHLDGQTVSVYMGDKVSSMIYICALLKQKVGDRLYRKDLTGSLNGRGNQRNIDWIRQVYYFLFPNLVKDFNDWYGKLKGIDMACHPINQGKSNCNAKIYEALKTEFPEAVFYSTLHLETRENESFYKIEIRADHIFLPEEMNGLLPDTPE